jgi:hypothetical protein
LSVGNHPRVKLLFKNFGQTPAYKFAYGFGWKLAKDDSFQDREPRPTVHRISRIMNPEETYGSVETAPFPLTAAQLAAIKTGQMRLYVWGRATFEDIFAQSQSINISRFVSGQMMIDNKWMAEFHIGDPKHDEEAPLVEAKTAPAGEGNSNNADGA